MKISHHVIDQRIAKALAFSAALIERVARAGRRYSAEFQTRLRIGVDSGAAVAINSGTRDEPDPLFIGPAANHAAISPTATRLECL